MPSMPCIAFYAFYALHCLLFNGPKILFREHLCAGIWHRLGLQSCWASSVSQPCPTALHTARTSNLQPVPTSFRPSMHLLSLFLLVSKMPFRHLICNAVATPLGLNLAVLHRLPSRPWTGFAIRLLVFALSSPGSFRRLDHRATCGASMGESTCNNTVAHAQLRAAAPDNVNCSVANIAVQ